VGADGTEAGNAVDDVDCQVEAIDLIDDGELKRRVDVAFFLVPAHVDVLVIPAAVGKFVDERGVRMKIEDDGLVDGEERVEITIRKPVRMFGGGHQTEKINDVDEANLEVGETLLEDRDGG